MSGKPQHDPAAWKPLLLAALAEGGSMAGFCREHRDGPQVTLWCEWLRKDEAFAKDYARAREDAGLAEGEEVAAIGRAVLLGKHEPDAARVAIDALKWSAARKAPKVYGERTTLDLNAKVELPPLDFSSLLPDAKPEDRGA